MVVGKKAAGDAGGLFIERRSHKAAAFPRSIAGIEIPRFAG
jgi:hypothetical protein